ncbi:MAG TPA: hypothetical protein VEY08_12710 [Chloroflexia bacterium]|nr:hypothetical protein [Chloroflexia bacterium]
MASRKVTGDEAQLNLRELLEELASGKGELLIEQDADSLFVVLPLDAYDRKRLARERVARTLEEKARNANLDPDEADKLAEEAVRWARANKDK